MRIRNVGKLFLIFSFLAAIYLLPFHSVSAQEFSADVITNSSGQEVSGKIFNAPGKARMEANGITTIARVDQNVAWVIMPNQTYMEVPLNSSNVIAGSDKMPGEIERTLVGKETLDGQEVDKYKIVYDVAGRRETIFSWIIPSSGIPVKTVAENNSWQVEYRNIIVGKQSDSLFEVPSGYQKFSTSSIKDLMQNTVKGAFNQGKSDY